MYQSELTAFLNRKLCNRRVYVVASDRLPTKFSLPAGFIINLSPSNHPGTHWVALYIDERGDGTYLCSFAMLPRVRTIQNFIRFHCKTIEYNRMQLQSPQSAFCGHYAAIFLIHMFKGLGLRHFQKQFSTNLILNDLLVRRMFLRFQNFSH